MLLIPERAFQVGFQSFDQNSLEVYLWYPAQMKSDAEPMRFVDFFLLSQEKVSDYKTRLVKFGIPGKAVDEWFDSRMIAVRNAEALTGKFPLILIAQGNFQTAHDQAMLSEYLAAHGYVVATCPSPTRSKPMETEADVLPTAMQQAADMKWMIDSLKDKPFIDRNRIAIVAHSFGARSALLLSFELPEVKAIVSLDGGIANREGKGWIEKSPHFRPEQFQTPLLHIYEDQEEFMQPDFDLLNSLKHSDRYLIKVSNMRHHEFSSYGFAAASIAGLSRTPDLKKKWDVISKYTLRFVDSFLKQDRTAFKFLQTAPPDENFTFQILRQK